MNRIIQVGGWAGDNTDKRVNRKIIHIKLTE
jgi:hypothetical protein